MDADWFLAAEQGLTKRILELHDRGADIEARDEFGQTALMLAANDRRVETVEALLKRGANVNALDKCGTTVMLHAAFHARDWYALGRKSWSEFVPEPRLWEVLMAAGGRPGLSEAILLSDVEMARRILDANPTIDINDESGISMHATYLMSAASLGPPAMVDLLLDRGAEIEGTDDIGQTALMVAAEEGRTDTVERLFDRGADINQGWPFESALALAQRAGHEETAALLLARGARLRLIDAIERDDLALAEELFRLGEEPDSMDYYRGSGSAEEREDRWDRYVIDAASRGNPEMVRLLLDHGGSLFERWSDRHSPLAEAAFRGHLEVVRLLLSRGAGVHDVGKDGKTALAMAIEGGHEAIAAELRRAGAVR